MKCKQCKQPGSIYLRYCGLRLCDEHFFEFIERKVEKTIKRYKMLPTRNERILVALSGGKDSQSLIYILKKILPEELPVIGLHVDLGISNHSEKSLTFVKKLQATLGFELKILDLKKQHGFSMSDIQTGKISRRPTCSLCGLVKRYLFNRIALDGQFTAIATGHLLDDEVTILMSNLINNNVEQLVRGGPFLPSREHNIVARMKPLYEVSEFETRYYATARGIPFLTDSCPYNVNATSKKLKKVTDYMEEMRPNSRLSLVRSYVKNYKKAFQDAFIPSLEEVKQCACGAPTTGETCSFCKIKDRATEVLRRNA